MLATKAHSLSGAIIPKLVAALIAVAGGWLLPWLFDKDYLITPWGTLMGLKLAVVLAAVVYLPATAGAAWVLSNGPSLTFDAYCDIKFTKHHVTGQDLAATWFHIGVINNDYVTDALDCEMSTSGFSPPFDGLQTGKLAVNEFEANRSRADIRAGSPGGYDIGWAFAGENVLSLAYLHPIRIQIGEAAFQFTLTFVAKGMRARTGTYRMEWVEDHFEIDCSRGFSNQARLVGPTLPAPPSN